MYKLTIASAALMASTVLAQNPGTAKVINMCKYDVHLSAVPAAGGGQDEVNKVLGFGDNYSQTYTELTNGNGWSIKMSKSADLANVLQYEYTYHPGEPIWYDLSEVNGNPWDGNWEITASGGDGCKPKQSAYRYATDDAYGMQDCNVDADITVTLCSGESQNDGGAASASESMSESATAEPTSASSTYVAPSSSSEATTSTLDAEPTSSEHAHHSHSWVAWNPSGGWFHQAVAESTASPTLTTFATKTATPAPGVTVTEVATAVVTEVVTMTHYADAKRDEHVHQHARRHPHARS